MSKSNKKPSAKTADNVFHYENFEDDDAIRTAFNTYFANLPDTDKPFDCPYVRALQSSVGIIFSNRPPWRYEIGDLICTRGAEGGYSRRCRFGDLSARERPPLSLKDGNLVFHCEISGIDLVTKVLETRKVEE